MTGDERPQLRAPIAYASTLPIEKLMKVKIRVNQGIQITKKKHLLLSTYDTSLQEKETSEL